MEEINKIENNNNKFKNIEEKIRKTIASMLAAVLITGNLGHIEKVNAQDIVSWYQLENENNLQFTSIKGFLEIDQAIGEFNGRYNLVGYDIERLSLNDKNKIEERLKFYGINVELDKLDIKLLKLYFQRNKKVKFFGIKGSVKYGQELDMLYFVKGNYFYVLGYKLGNSYDFNLFRYPVRYRINNIEVSRYERKVDKNGKITIKKINIKKKVVKIYGKNDRLTGIKKLFLEIEF